MQMSI